MKWTEDEVKAFTHLCLAKHWHYTPSAIVLMSNYAGNTEWRFDKMRAFVEQEIKIHKQWKDLKK